MCLGSASVLVIYPRTALRSELCDQLLGPNSNYDWCWWSYRPEHVFDRHVLNVKILLHTHRIILLH